MGLLTVKTCNRASQPGTISDGENGLSLRVHRKANGTLSKSWVQKLRIHGRSTTKGHGSFPAVSLAEARRRALKAKALALQGGDPRRPVVRVTGKTLGEVAERLMADWTPGWAPATAERWQRTYKHYVPAKLLSLPADRVTPSDMHRALQGVWREKNPTGKRAKMLLKRVYTAAIQTGMIERRDNPCDKRLDSLLVSPPKRAPKPYPALPYRKALGVVPHIRESWTGNPAAAMALEMVILLPSRPSELLAAKWKDVDMERGTLTLREKNRKTRREFVVTLSEYAKAVLRRAREAYGDKGLIFPTRRGGQIHRNEMGRVLRRTGITVASASGFRRTFRNWAAADNKHRLAELCLDHQPQGVEASYWTDTMEHERRELLEAWGTYVAGIRGMGGWND